MLLRTSPLATPPTSPPTTPDRFQNRAAIVTSRSKGASPVEIKSEARATDRILRPSLQQLDALDADSIVCGYYEDVRPLPGLMGFLDWRLCGRLSRLLEAGTITGAADEKVLFPTLGRVPAPRLFLYGWGKRTEGRDKGQERVKAMLEIVDKAKGKKVVFAFPEPPDNSLHLVDDVEKSLGNRLVGVF